MNRAAQGGGEPFAEDMPGIRARAAAVSRHVRLNLGSRTWRGAVGNWAGSGSGSSIDFQDHRPYIPGDDPRHIDWAAYARSGNYIMKLYREEVSPRVDLLLDVSDSMWLEPEKRRRTLELLCFCVESALAMGAAPVAACVGIAGYHPIEIPALLAGRWTPPAPSQPPVAPDPARLPLRPGSLRVMISDLLFDAPPESILRPLCAAKGRAIVFAPWTASEQTPDWDDNIELIDCESGQMRRQRVNATLRERYRRAYDAHFSAWRDQARRCDACLARVGSSAEFARALQDEALPQGAVEAWA